MQGLSFDRRICETFLIADYRAQIVSQPHTSDPGRDYTTNVLAYSAPTTAPSAIGDGLMAAFTTGSSNVYGSWANVWVKIYDRAAPLHSPPVYQAHYTGGGSTSLMPRQVALCLSFYSGLNVRGQRGRIYIGPWANSVSGEFASTTVLTTMQNLANALKHPGGADVIHQILHKKTATWSNVSNYFINNVWDTMRSRLPKETARVTA